MFPAGKWDYIFSPSKCPCHETAGVKLNTGWAECVSEEVEGEREKKRKRKKRK